MDKLEMKDEFSELYKVMSASSDVRLMRIFGAVMSSMMCDVIDVHPALAEEYISRFRAIKWRNYLTAKEASGIVQGMNPPAMWDISVWNAVMKKLSLETEEPPYYNSCALYVVMNQVVSDHASSIARLSGKKSISDMQQEDVVECAYLLAVDLLKDKDGMYDIRKYFNI